MALLHLRNFSNISLTVISGKVSVPSLFLKTWTNFFFFFCVVGMRDSLDWRNEWFVILFLVENEIVESHDHSCSERIWQIKGESKWLLIFSNMIVTFLLFYSVQMYLQSGWMEKIFICIQLGFTKKENYSLVYNLFSL